MQILAFLPVLILIPLILLVTNKRLIWISTIVLGTLSITCLLLEIQLYAISGFHVNASVFSYFLSKRVQGFFDFSDL